VSGWVLTTYGVVEAIWAVVALRRYQRDDRRVG
jgi:hypothetical protein